MKIERGEIWIADLNPIRGSEQAGTRPVLIVQNDYLTQFTKTFLAIPLTTTLKRANLPTSVSVPAGEAGLNSNSVILCHQLRVLDQTRLIQKLGTVSQNTLVAAESALLFALGIV
jgi:mRNA interferase MazF